MGAFSYGVAASRPFARVRRASLRSFSRTSRRRRWASRGYFFLSRAAALSAMILIAMKAELQALARIDGCLVARISVAQDSYALLRYRPKYTATIMSFLSMSCAGPLKTARPLSSR